MAGKVKLIFEFEPFRIYHTEKLECMFCQTEYPLPPAIVTLSEIFANGDTVESCWFMCPACILSDAKTLTKTIRTTVGRNRAKRKELRSKAKADLTDAEQGFLNGDEDFSSTLNGIAKRLDHLGDVSKIINHDLAVIIAKHYVGKAA